MNETIRYKNLSNPLKVLVVFGWAMVALFSFYFMVGLIAEIILYY